MSQIDQSQQPSESQPAKSRFYVLADLLYLMTRLRDTQTGCPWDLKQSYRSITPSTIEEAYEVADAIERGDFGHLKEELGDLLFQIIFYSQLAREEGRFEFSDIVDLLTAKLLRRHPHVFPDGTLESQRIPGREPDDQKIKAAWEGIKQEEREAKGKGGVLDDIPVTLPPMTRAVKLQKRAASLGFDWRELKQVLAKIDEEVAELKEAYVEGDMSAVEAELGDLMFTCINFARHAGRDPELVMRSANNKFETRVRQVEIMMKAAAKADFTDAELDQFWQQAKQVESLG